MDTTPDKKKRISYQIDFEIYKKEIFHSSKPIEIEVEVKFFTLSTAFMENAKYQSNLLIQIDVAGMFGISHEY